MEIDHTDLLCRVFKALPSWLPPERVILLGLRGSLAHGTYIPPDEPQGTDDIDIFVVGVQPRDWYLGLESYRLNKKGGMHYESADKELDILAYDVRKFGYLLQKGNPNVHNWLWSPDDCYLHVAPAGRLLIDNREAFISRRLLRATSGYAYAQLLKMSKSTNAGYMGAKRKALVKQYGYDIRHAAHCARLLLMGQALAASGELVVRLPHEHGGAVRAIKQGEWSYDRVRTFLEHTRLGFDTRCGWDMLPERPDYERCNRLIVDAIEHHQFELSPEIVVYGEASGKSSLRRFYPDTVVYEGGGADGNQPG